jgi:hypothetical protein
MSSHTPNEPAHTTAFVCGSAGWNSIPKEAGTVVDIYSRGLDPSSGYHNYYIQRKIRNRLSAPSISGKITDALANDRGLLTNGQLVPATAAIALN